MARMACLGLWIWGHALSENNDGKHPHYLESVGGSNRAHQSYTGMSSRSTATCTGLPHPPSSQRHVLCQQLPGAVLPIWRWLFNRPGVQVHLWCDSSAAALKKPTVVKAHAGTHPVGHVGPESTHGCVPNAGELP